MAVRLPERGEVASWQQRWSLWNPRNRHIFAYLLMAPAVLTTAIVILYPLMQAIALSFQKVKIADVGAGPKPFTLVNYQNLVRSEEFWKAFLVTLELVAIVTVLCLVLGMATALLVNQRFRGRPIARLLVTLPWAVPAVVAAVIWWWIFDSSYGILNWLLLTIGVITKPILWFNSLTGAFFVVVMVMLWKGYPFVAIMLVAGLQAIPEELYEAAKIDGAGAWQRFRHVALPGLRSVMTIALLLVILWVFRDFPIIMILTGGGPLRATQTLAILTYQEGFSFFNMGYAAAIGVVTLILCLFFSAIMVRRMAVAD